MNLGAMLPDVKASLPIPGQRVGTDLSAIERACVPGIEADCSHVPFTSIMVRPLSVSSLLLPWLILPARGTERFHMKDSLAHDRQTQRLRGLKAHKGSSSASDHSVALPVAPKLLAALCCPNTAAPF